MVHVDILPLRKMRIGNCLSSLGYCGNQSKFDCLVFEMLFIKKLKPNLNIQTDSIRAKLFV